MKRIFYVLFIIMAVSSFGASVLPQNTTIMIKMDSTLDSKSAYNGQIFTGTLQSNLTLEDGSIVPKGSKIFGRVIDSKSAGNVTGSSKLAITLSEVQLEGFNYGINTTAIGFEGENQGAKAVKTSAKTAAVGGLISKATGSSGSKGLKVGGAIGAGGSALTNTGTIGIRAGEILQFKTTTAVVVGK